MNRSILKSATGLVAMGIAAATLSIPAEAMAAANTGTTEVTVQASNDNLKFRVPTVIPFSAAADGKLTGPSPSATTIENLSVFGIHVTNMSVKAEAPWTLVSDAAESDEQNSIDFQVGPADALQDAAAASEDAGIDLGASAAFDLAHTGAAGDTVQLSSAGDIARPQGDLHTAADKVATITWTLEAGQHDAG